MGALRQPRLSEANLKKPPATESRKLDQYGRDPASPVEQLRGGTGFSPLFHAMLADLPRLVEGSAAGWALVMTILRLSLGRPHDADKGRYEKTEPISTAELAVLMRSNLRTAQRQIDELSERGVIGCESKGAKTGKYVLSLQLANWRKLPDYAVWQKLQIHPADESPADDETEDEDQTPISKDAVILFKKPAVARPGKATRAAKLTAGARDLVCQNNSPTVDISFGAVLQSGRIVVSATVAKTNSETKAKVDDTHVVSKTQITERVAVSENGERKVTQLRHPRANDVVSVFDTPLNRWNSKVISCDDKCLWSACAELGEMPTSYLEWYVNDPKKGRAKREISGPRAVIAIVREARNNWEKQVAAGAEMESQERRCACGKPISIDGQCWECHGVRS